jgi:hypothetical protein
MAPYLEVYSEPPKILDDQYIFQKCCPTILANFFPIGFNAAGKMREKKFFDEKFHQGIRFDISNIK